MRTRNKNSRRRTTLHFRLGMQSFATVQGMRNCQPAARSEENHGGVSHPQATVSMPQITTERVQINGEKVLRLYVRSGTISPGKVIQGYDAICAHSRRWLAGYLKTKRREGYRRLDMIINCTGGATAFADGYSRALKHCGMRGRILIDGACCSAATIIAYTPGWPVAITAGSHMLIHYASRTKFRKRKGVWEKVSTLTGDIGLSTTDDVMLALYRRRTGRSEEQIREWMASQKQFRAAEAVAFGLADEMVIRSEWEKGDPT